MATDKFLDSIASPQSSGDTTSDDTSSSPSSSTSPVQSSKGDNFLGSLFKPKEPTSTPSIENSTSSVSSQKSDNFLGSLFPEQELNSPEKQDVVQSKGEGSTQNDPWYKKAWDFVNEPLFDEGTMKNWFGTDVHSWGGLGEGFFNLISGLTSPLQLALTIGTFGSSTLLDAGGVAALKAEGWAAKEIESVISASSLASKAIKAGHNVDKVWQGMAAVGFDVQKITEGLDIIKNAGLTPESLIATGVIRRAGSSALRQAGMGVGMAENIGQWTQAAIDAGFTVQNAYAAAITSPRVFDAIKEGDYETAKKLAVEAAGMGLFAGLGAHQAATHAGELMPDAAAKMGLRVKPSEENLKLIKEFEAFDRENIINSESQKQWEKDMRNRHGDLKFDDMQRARFFYESGSSTNDLSKWYNAISEASGRDTRKPITESPKFNETSSTVSPDAYLKTVGDAKGADPKVIAELKDKHLAGQGDTIPPVEITYDEQGNITGADGRHRAAAALQAGVDRIPVTVKRALPIDPVEEQFKTRIQEIVDKAKLKEKPAEYIDRLLDQLDPDKLTDQHKEFSKEVSDHFYKTLEKAKVAGALKEGAENYMTRVFKDSENESVRSYRSVADSSGNFNTDTVMMRRRTFDTTLEGLLNGHELAELDPIALAAHNGNEFGRAINARDALQRLMENGIRTSDGRLMVAPDGDGHAMFDKEGNRVGTAVQPSRSQSLSIPDKVLNGFRNNIVKKGEAGKPDITELDRLLKQGQVTKYGIDKKTGEQLYAWVTSDYRDIDNNSFRKWSVVTQDSQGKPIYIESKLKAHPEAYEYLNRRFGKNESVVSKIPGMKTLLKLGQEAKGILLFGSPFHIMQEGLRAVMTGISPFGHVEFDANNPIHRLAAEKGVWEGKEYKGATAFQEGLAGHSKLLSKIPGLAQIQDWQQKFLFDRYIPSLKLRAFEKLYDRYQKAYPDWAVEGVRTANGKTQYISPEKMEQFLKDNPDSIKISDKAASVAAADTANRFGGIPYKRMGRAAGTMDAARIMALAPDWLESEMRFMGSMFGEGGKITRRDTAKMALALWGVSRVLNAVMNNGNMHNEAPFGVALKDDDGREKIYSVRTLPTDMLHAASDPEGFLRGRVSPLVRTGIQTYTGRDEFGRKLPEHGVWINALRNISPIAVQAGVKKMTGEDPGISNADSFVKAAGFTVFGYRTEAQKLAAKIASSHSTGGEVDPDKLRRHSALLRTEDQVRSGQVPLSTIIDMVHEGTLHRDEAKIIETNVKETAGMDPDLARLYMHASRAPMKNMLEIFDAATNQEKSTLSRLFLKKKTAYMKNAFKNMSQSERQQDPVYTRLRQMFPQDVSF